MKTEIHLFVVLSVVAMAIGAPLEPAFSNAPSTEKDGNNLWTVVKVCGAKNQLRFINQATKEYLYAAADDLAKDPERRRVFTWANLSTIPESHPSYWYKTADWTIMEEDQGFLLRNVKYNEYLYSAADGLALSEEQRSVFTWKNYQTLGFEGFWKFNKDIQGFLDDVATSYLFDVEIRSVRYNALLLAGSFFKDSDIERRNVYVDRTKQVLSDDYDNEEESSNLWTILKVFGTNNQVRFVNQDTEEYLYAADDDLAKDPERRRVFTWTNLSTIPESHPRYWDKTADWIIKEEDQGFLLRNVKYNEYLYSAADDMALSEEQRSVFTWKNYQTLGFEGFWKFNKDIQGFLLDTETELLNDVEIRSVRYDAQLMSGSLFKHSDADRRNVFVERTNQEVAGAVEITTYSTDEADYVDDGQTGSSLDLHGANETGTDAIGYINGDHTNDIDDDLTNDIDNDIDNDISGKAVIQIL